MNRDRARWLQDDHDVRFSRRVFGSDGSSGGAVNFENGEWWHNAGWPAVRSFASRQ